ncbi:MAG: PDZ domain-containing protein, partial [Pseudomonadota bacterium]|nr:PDZ domain-containing protein [Pseudomonadota bacterium]
VIREGARERLRVAVGELGDSGGRIASAGSSQASENVLGLAVIALPDSARERLEVDGGVQIERVEPDGPAEAAGLSAGDVLTRLNNQSIESVGDFVAITKDLPRGRSIPVLVIRGGVATFIPLRIPEED